MFPENRDLARPQRKSRTSWFGWAISHDLRPKYPLRDLAHETFVKPGHEDIQDAFTGDQVGIASFSENWHVSGLGDSLRQPSAKAYDLSETHVITDVAVQKVVIASGSGKHVAEGVALIDGRQMMAQKEVNLSCELEKIGVSLIVGSPDVGQNFFDHMSLFEGWRLRYPEKGLATGSPLFKSPEYMDGYPVDWIVFDNVPSEELKSSLQQEDAKVDDYHPHLKLGRCHITTVLLYAPVALDPEAYSTLTFDGTYIGTSIVNFVPTSRCKISLSSDNASDDVIIDANYNATATNRTVLRTAVRRIVKVMETPPLAEEVEGERPPDGWKPLASSCLDEEIDDRIRAFATTWHHPMGTAAMGKVVDSEMKVKGVAGLRVVDARIFPGPMTATPQSTVYAIAEMAAEMIAGEL